VEKVEWLMVLATMNWRWFKGQEVINIVRLRRTETCANHTVKWYDNEASIGSMYAHMVITLKVPLLSSE
jgi:hypothetical protein